MKLHACVCKMVSRRKKIVISVVLLGTVLAVVHFMNYQADYAPLQALSSAQNEAQRLIRFLTSYQYNCNSTLYTPNSSVWTLCVDQDAGISLNSNTPKVVYSIGPLPDYSFEVLLSRNMSVRQLVFVSQPLAMTPRQLLQLNITIYHTTIVPNDPADFGRNSFNMHTINSIMSKLGHHHVDILKLESVEDMMHSYEVLYFMVKDGILARFHQLHVVMTIDKVDENYLYSWYKTLYTLFHSAGFRLYHTSATSPLCLQVTMMESCRYFMSWVQNPGPRKYVLYPPALDGSCEYEVQRLNDFLDVSELHPEDVITVLLSASTKLRLSRQVIMSQSDSCHILVFRLKTGSTVIKELSALHVKCSVSMLSPPETGNGRLNFSFFIVRNSSTASENMTLSSVVSQLLAQQQTNIVYIEYGQSGWEFLTLLLNSGALQNVQQLVFVAPIIPSHSTSSAHWTALALRQRYSELQRISAFDMTLSEAISEGHKSLKFFSDDLWRMTFVKSGK